jgi:molybdopterin-guanine dinucleotide biosynthesis protein A
MSFAGKFSGAVLAGGRSTRMGTDKAFLRIGDELLIERQLRGLRETGATELLISGRSGADYAEFQGKVVYDEHLDAGPLAGLASLLKAAAYPLIVVLAVDMPAITPAMLIKILATCSENCGCVPIDGDRFEPLAAAYPKQLLALAEDRVANGKYSMHGLVSQAISEKLMQPLVIDAQDRGCFVNWNEPFDWQPAP